MDLKDKLKYYQVGPAVSKPEKKVRYAEIADFLGGILVEADTLPVIRIDRFFPYDRFSFNMDSAETQAVHLPFLTKKQFPDKISVEKILIFDLETTGLAGGTGTYPFLIGFGRFENSGIGIVQYFLPDFGREISAFLEMRQFIEGKTTLLSYNGKSFDYPLLRNRMIMNRMENPLEKFVHLDLLHPARRLWRNALPSCSLDTIEEEIFLFNRHQDIGGSLIPQAYFDFLQTGEATQIRKIISHNQQDIISLGRLLFHLHSIENSRVPESHSAAELIAMLDLAIDSSDLKRIKLIFEELDKKRKEIPELSLIKYSLLLKRLKKWDHALQVWQRCLENSMQILFASEELAKYYEHRENNLVRALDYTNRGLQYIDLMQELTPESADLAESRKNFLHRLWRLNTKRKQRE